MRWKQGTQNSNDLSYVSSDAFFLILLFLRQYALDNTLLPNEVHVAETF
jgi:hypothetical protein